MIPLPDQLSAARTAQFHGQIDFMRALTAQAFATAEQVLALNINTSRESMERTASTVRQMWSISDPRDLFTLGAQTQEQLSTLYNYGRELINIAADARLDLARRMAAQPAPQSQDESRLAEQPVPMPEAAEPAAASAPAAVPEQTAAPAAPLAEARPKAASRPRARKLAVVDDKPAAPRARAKPIARAVGKLAASSAGFPHPAAAPVAVEPGAPSAAVLELKQPETPAPKAQRKK